MARHPLRSPPHRRKVRRVSRLGVVFGLGMLVIFTAGFAWWWQYHWEREGRLSDPAPIIRFLPTNELRTNELLAPSEPTPPTTPPSVALSSPPTLTNTPALPPPATNPPPAAPPPLSVELEVIPQRPPTNILEAQIALAAQGISAGPIDGVGGTQTAWALRAFQFQRGLEETGRLDPDTQQELKLVRPLFRTLTVTAADLAEIRRVPVGWLDKSRAGYLGFSSVLEMAAERSHAHQALIRRLNPAINWETVEAGTVLIVPYAVYPPPRRAALVRISLANRYLRAFDARGQLLAHFPCSIGRIAEKRPVGELQTAVVVKDPNYTFDPAVFPEDPEARQIGRKLILPAGPNNPVGVAWIGLSRPGYGIHGTPIPEQVGRTESHGCFRLANWNADFLRQMMSVGTPVWVER